MLFKFSLCWYFVATLAMLATATGSNLPNQGWDSYVTDIDEGSFSPASSSVYDPLRAPSSSPQSFDIQSTRLGPLRPLDRAHHPATSNEMAIVNAYSDLDRDLRGLQEQSIARDRNGLRELNMEEKTMALRRIQLYFRDAAGSHAFKKTPIFKPAGRVPKEQLEAFARDLLTLPHRYGPWPFQVEDERFLLHQIRHKTPHSDEINNIKYPGPSRDSTLLGAWKELKPRGSNNFQYVGLFQGPHHRLLRDYVNNVLLKHAAPLADLEMLSDSTFRADFFNPTRALQAAVTHPPAP